MLIHIIVFSALIVASLQLVEEPIECTLGYCTPKHLCPKNGTYDPKYAQNTNIVQLRIDLDVNEHDECIDYMKTCCPNQSLNEATTPPPIVNLEVPEATDYSVCGQSNENGLIYNLRHNKSYSQFAEFPWVVYIFKYDDSGSKQFVCGGTLIHHRFVVTAAHNVDQKSNLIARFGEWDVESSDEALQIQDIAVANILKHKDYVHNPINNDIALLQLVSDVVYDKHIRPICLPTENQEFVGKRCISNGWGREREQYAKLLKKLSLPIVARDQCVENLRSNGLGPYWDLPDGFMCAGGEPNVDMCEGDGGSPLACQQENGNFVLAGIVSWGIGCSGKIPGVYVSVNRYINWINNHMTDFDLEQ